MNKCQIIQVLVGMWSLCSKRSKPIDLYHPQNAMNCVLYSYLKPPATDHSTKELIYTPPSIPPSIRNDILSRFEQLYDWDCSHHLKLVCTIS
uniref:RH11383p n=1 Tax=Drosophila melanogaster TaxID=7227 RepID=Q8SY99_DROME|nr:RH11383p [Drosophila melanogaster]